MKNSSKTVLGISGVALAFGLFAASHVQAAQITGSIAFGMIGTAANAGGPLTSFTGATMIDFATPTPTNGFITGVSGDYTGFTLGAGATFTDLDFATPIVPVIPLWTTTGAPGTASFDLLSVNIDNQTANLLKLSGTGTLRLTGFDDTAASWTLSGDISNQSVVFGISSTNTATPVPEPTILALLGIGLLGLIGRRFV